MLISKKYKDNRRIKVSLSQNWIVGKFTPRNVYLDVCVYVCVRVTLYTCLFFSHFVKDRWKLCLWLTLENHCFNTSLSHTNSSPVACTCGRKSGGFVVRDFVIVSWLHHILVVKSYASYLILLSFSYLINLKIIKKNIWEWFWVLQWNNLG